MSRIQVIVNGSTGRMGKEIQQHCESSARTVFYFGINRNTKDSEIQSQLKTKLKSTVLIDFSTPTGLSRAIRFCRKYKLPLISGTTGITPKQQREMRQLSRIVPVLWAPNMSVGVNLFLKMISSLGAQLSQYDLLLEDKHHKHKKDSPSGTAKLIAAGIKNASNKSIDVHSVRGGGIIGIHKLWLMGEEEFLTIEHTATHRSVFARGSIRAANWIINKKPGLYTFQDLLN